MKVTFIEHSGFMVEMEQNVLLFDYYQGEIPSFDGSKTLYVFASHSHADHYDPAIWKLKEQYKDIHYILSDDIKDNEGAVVMKAHEKKEVAGIEIETLRSNDMGVAFLVKVEGKTIYHAGDLNWWHWNGEPEEDNEYYKKTFQDEMKYLEGKKIDLAFMLLDPRQEDKYCWGMNYFLEHTDSKVVFPMHCFEHYNINHHYLNCEDGRRWKDIVRDITGAGQVFAVSQLQIQSLFHNIYDKVYKQSHRWYKSGELGLFLK